MLLERSKNGPNLFSFGQRTFVSFSVKLSIKRKRRLWCPSSEWDVETLKQQYGTLAVSLKPFIYKVLSNGCAVLYPALLAGKRRDITTSAWVKIIMGLVHQIVFQILVSNSKSHHVKHTSDIKISKLISW